MSIKRRDFDGLIRKFGFQTKQGHHLSAWLEVDGKTAVRTRRSNGKGDLPAQHLVRQQLHLNEDEFRAAIDCSLDLNGYIAILREKNII